MTTPIITRVALCVILFLCCTYIVNLSYKIMLSKFEFFAVAVKNKVYSEELVIKCASESIFWTFSKLFPFMIGKLRQADDRFSASLWLAERCIQGNANKQRIFQEMMSKVASKTHSEAY